MAGTGDIQGYVKIIFGAIACVAAIALGVLIYIWF